MCKKILFYSAALSLLWLVSRTVAAGPFQQYGADGLVVIECEDFDGNVAQGGHSFEFVTKPAGYSGKGAMQALPNDGTNNNANYVTSSPRLDYKVNFTKTGLHYVWLRAHANGSGSDDSAHSGLDGQAIATADRINLNSAADWIWTNAAYQDTDPPRIVIDVKTAGLHTFNLWMREDGALFDKVVLTTNPDYTPTGFGPVFEATKPSPADGATGVQMILLTWTAGVGAVARDVYFGTDPNPPLVGAKQTAPVYFSTTPTVPGTTYYWRVDEIDADGTIHPGPVWKFMGDPVKDYAPTPADGGAASAASLTTGQTLTWKAGKDAVQHQVYFGTDLSAVTNGAASADKGKVTDVKFATIPLRLATTYYWRVDVIKADQSVIKGDVWSFTTPEGGVLHEVWSNISGTAVTNLTSNANYPKNPSISELLTVFDGPVDWADNYGTRLSGLLMPPGTGNYTFWVSGDDETQLWLSTDANPSNAKMIANVAGWTPARDFDNTQGGQGGPSQKSAPISLQAGQKYYIMALQKEGSGGDSVTAAWQGPGIPVRAIIQGLYVSPPGALPPLQAVRPNPANGTTGTAHSLTLGWAAGDKALKHDVYLGTDKAAVAAADTTSLLYKGQQAGTTFDTGDLAWGTTYYWRVDEVNPGEAESPWKGSVWSFTTSSFLVVDDMEAYNDSDNTIFDTWIDGVTDKKSGSTVGYDKAPFAERTIVHGGAQSMPLAFDNTGKFFFSEAVQTFSTLQDWTTNDVTTLSLWVRGYPAVTSMAVTETGGKMTLTGGGTDIWNNSDDFVFAYKTLTGDGTIVARVVSIGAGTNTWAKGGVMIRDSLNGGSTFVDQVMTANSDGTAGNGSSFQYRLTANGGCGNTDSTAVLKPPYWVKLQRTGDAVSGYVSANGTTWAQMGTTQTIKMTAPVYLGICVTAHQAGEQRTVQFDGIATTGNVSSTWQGAQINSPAYNGAGSMYVVVEDSAGKTATATNATAVNSAAWTNWKIALKDLTGVSLSKVKKLYLGVGDRKATAAGGAGLIFIDDIQVTK